MFSDKFILKILNRNLLPEIRQEIRLLKLSEEFRKDYNLIKKTHKELIDSRNKLFKKAHEDYSKKDKENKKIRKIGSTNKSKDLLKILAKTDLRKNKKFKKDIIALAKKYRLYPLYYWEVLLIEIIAVNWLMGPIHFNNFLILTSFFRGTKKVELVVKENYKGKNQALCLYISNDCAIRDIEKFWTEINRKIKEVKMGKDYVKKINNFRIFIEKNTDTNEKELWLLLPDKCTFPDIKKYYSKINKKLKDLRNSEGNAKRYYPLKKIDETEYILKRKKRVIEEKKYLDDDDIRKFKETDLTIAEEIATEQAIEIRLGKEKQYTNRIKQRRYQYKNNRNRCKKKKEK